TELRVTAAGTLARGTMSPTEACQDGLFSAVPESIRKVKASSSQGLMQPCQVKMASSTDITSMKYCATSTTGRRTERSAKAAATSANSMMGRVVEAWTRATW